MLAATNGNGKHGRRILAFCQSALYARHLFRVFNYLQRDTKRTQHRSDSCRAKPSCWGRRKELQQLRF
jgi:hypothetical protein